MPGTLIYEDQTGKYFADATTHAYVGRILGNMGMRVNFYGCMYETEKDEPAATIHIEEDGKTAYVIGINGKFTEGQKISDGLLALDHECGHVYMMERHPFLNWLLEFGERHFTWAHKMREYEATRIGTEYSKGILPDIKGE
jgi:hypothetical protein